MGLLNRGMLENGNVIVKRERRGFATMGPLSRGRAENGKVISK